MAEEKKLTLLDPEHPDFIPICLDHRMRISGVVDKGIIKQYIDKHDLKVVYIKEMRDGTPRRLWDLLDPSGGKCGQVITAMHREGRHNKSNWDLDLFDYAEVFVPFEDWDDKELKAPHSKHFRKKE